MIDFKNYKNINEYDEIILKWKKDDKTQPMKYVIVEDLKNKCWIIYDSSTGLYKEVSFGEYVESVINEFLLYDMHNAHHSKLLDMITSDSDFDEQKANDLFNYCKKPVEQLLELLGNISKYRILAKKGELIGNSGICINSEMLEQILMNEWKKYRYINFVSVWQRYANYEFSTSEDAAEYKNKFSSFLDSSKEEILKEWKEFAKEEAETLHAIVRESFVCYYDYIIFIDKDGNPRTGRSFVAANEMHIFCWDLYHILVSKCAEAPHICPRCKQLFFSNNNKAVYCEKCKTETNIVRNENRKKSVRYMHKKIYDKINNSKFHNDLEKELFLAESNYYWDIVKKKDVKLIPLFTEKIECEEDYKEWLERKMKSL